jgi:hypothetical protein
MTDDTNVSPASDADDDPQPIEGVVAAILTPRELAINIGSDAGVTKGMRFAVLNRNSLDIKDPISGEALGSVPVPKVVVEVFRVETKLSIARTFKKRTVNVGGSPIFGGVGGNLFAPPRFVDEHETLQTEQKPYVEELSEEESYVKTGDPVVEVTDNSYFVGVDT